MPSSGSRAASRPAAGLGLGESWIFPLRWHGGVFPGCSRSRRNSPSVRFLWEDAKGSSELKAVLWGIAAYAFKHIIRLPCSRTAEELRCLSDS